MVLRVCWQVGGGMRQAVVNFKVFLADSLDIEDTFGMPSRGKAHGRLAIAIQNQGFEDSRHVRGVSGQEQETGFALHNGIAASGDIGRGACPSGGGRVDQGFGIIFPGLVKNTLYRT